MSLNCSTTPTVKVPDKVFDRLNQQLNPSYWVQDADLRVTPKPITEIDLFGNQSFVLHSPKPMPNRWKRFWHKAFFGTIYRPLP